MDVDSSDLILSRFYAREKAQANEVYLTQPMAGGRVHAYTWAEVGDEARRMAAYLGAFGFPPGSRIAIMTKNCAHFILSDLAIWMAGHVSVALYPTSSAEATRFVLEHSGARLLLVGKVDRWHEMKLGVPQHLPGIACSLAPPTDYPMWEDIIARTAPMPGNPTHAPDAVATIIYTSGSTGDPKGAVHTFSNIAAACKGIGQVIESRPDDRMVSYLPLAHAFERLVVEALSIYYGSQVFFVESPDTFLVDIQRARPTIFHSVPRLWLKFQQGVLASTPDRHLQLLLKVPVVAYLLRRRILRRLGLDQTRIAISGTAPIPPEQIHWYRNLGLELLEGYAMSENFSYSHFSLPGKARIGYVGAPLPGVEVRVNEDGEILVKSPATMQGYWSEPTLTTAAFTEDGFLKTGDRGEIDDHGLLRLTGRTKDLFKTSKGNYVAPAPIENLLNATGRIEQSCVMGHSLPQPFAVVALSEELRHRASNHGRAEVEAELAIMRESVNSQLSSSERLDFIAVAKDPWLIDNGVLTATMKIRREVLEARYSRIGDAWHKQLGRVVWED